MGARNITIVNSRTQNRKVIVSGAETLGELKADLRDNNIDFNGLAFFEGISKSELKEDNAILPKDLPWKGSRTNDLVFMLTEPQKKIRNGAVASRAEAYAYIKANNLQDAIQKKFGNNFTRCKTPDLIEFCNKKATPAPKAAPAKTTAKVVRKPSQTAVSVAAPAPKTEPTSNCSCEKLTNLLVAKGIITLDEAITGEPTLTQPADITDQDIKNLFNSVR